MSVEYEELDMQFDVLLAEATGSGPGPTRSQGADRLREALRPLVAQLVEEELDRRMRQRGSR